MDRLRPRLVGVLVLELAGSCPVLRRNVVIELLISGDLFTSRNSCETILLPLF